MTRHNSMMQGGVVEKEKTPHARGPGFESLPENFFPFFLSFFNFFFYLQTGFNLFIVMLLCDKAY